MTVLTVTAYVSSRSEAQAVRDGVHQYLGELGIVYQKLDGPIVTDSKDGYKAQVRATGVDNSDAEEILFPDDLAKFIWNEVNDYVWLNVFVPEIHREKYAYSEYEELL